MPAGRPLKFKSVEELQKKIDDYFYSCDSHTSKVVNKLGQIIDYPDPEPYTLTGLAYFLDTTRDVLLDYEDRDEYSSSIKKAKVKIEAFAESQLYKLRNPAGAIFNLTNNYKRWVNKQNTEVTGNPEAPVQSVQTIKFEGINRPDFKAEPGVPEAEE